MTIFDRLIRQHIEEGRYPGAQIALDFLCALPLSSADHVSVVTVPVYSFIGTGVVPEGPDLLRDRGCEDPRRLSAAPAGLVHVNMGTQLDVSSSAVRDVVAAGRDPRYLMPEAVRRIIIARGSYARPGETEE